LGYTAQQHSPQNCYNIGKPSLFEERTVFDSDRPIQSNEQDRLGRATFAKYLARCILDHKYPESLAIGLYGGWGSGKTSIINLMIEELNSAANNMFDDEKPIILNFSPWSYSGQNQLIYAFFRRLSSTIRQAPFLENSEKIIQLLELYVSYFTHKPIPDALRIKPSWSSRLRHPFTNNKNIFGWESGRDLTQIKAELNDLLAHQKHKIIIVVDNVSRIESNEIKQIFQIVKSMGDYTNTVYLLSIDKEHILNTLGEGGEEYLEKIIQLPFEVPAISTQDLENILLDRLKSIIDTIPEGGWNSEYWADVYYPSLKLFFKNCRDITRFINTLSFGFPRVKDIVNPVDFFSLTAIRVFEPKIFDGIRDNKDLFTNLINNVYQLNHDKIKEDKLRCNEILNRAENFSPEMLKKLLIRLFPRLHSIYEENLPMYHSEHIARQNKRVCSPDVFDVYFRFSLPTGFISETEMDTVLTATNDKDGFSQALLRLNQDDRITKFLGLLDGIAVTKIPTQNIENVICALMNSGDLFPEGETNATSFDTAVRIHRICHQLLRRLPTQAERFNIYLNAINQANNSLYIIVHELLEQSKEHIGDESTLIPVEHRDINPEQLDILQKSITNKIAQLAEVGRLAEHPKLLPLLYAWKNWGDEEACAAYVMKMTKDDRGIVAFLCATLKKPIDEAMSKQEKNADWEESLKNIEAFISTQQIEPHAKELFEDQYFEKLREREQLAILIFLDLIKAETSKIIPKTSN
jgi:predicted KAP-like P-loop ATPase